MARNKKTDAATPATAATTEAASPKKEYTLFKAPGSVNLANLKRLNLPRMIKPADVPVDGIVSGEIMAVVNSPVSTVKGYLLHLKHETGEQFLFPCTGVIRQALAPGREKDDVALKGLLEKFVGKTIYAKRLESSYNEKYKKDMFQFDVFTS